MRKTRMTAAWMILTVVLTIAGTVTCYADDFDLSGMSTKELETLKENVDEELAKSHQPTLKQKNSVEKATKQFMEEKYGKENVDFSRLSAKCSKEWDFYTLDGHVKILKEDGGEVKYDVYSEVIADGKDYSVVYLKLGNEVVQNDRERITDKRVLKYIETKEKEETAG